MESLKGKISEVSFYLQRLTDPVIFSRVQGAVANRDKDAFVKACNKVKIPKHYIAVIMTILFAVPTQFQWPP